MPPGLGLCFYTYIAPLRAPCDRHHTSSGLWPRGSTSDARGRESSLFVRLSHIDFNADNAGNTSDASDVIDGSASRTHAPP